MPHPQTLQMVPGPTTIPEDVRAVYAASYGSADLEPAFFEDYAKLCKRLQAFLYTKNDIVVMMGEAMVCLWSGLKSVLVPGDRVLAVSNGVYGEGIGEMARGLGAEVTFVRSDWESAADTAEICRKIAEVKPKLVTMCHCETPSGLLNRMDGIGAAVHAVGGLLYVDFVSSAGGAEVRVDDWGIDLGLLGSQKVLSLAPDLGVMTVSARAWEVVEKVKYAGYDALLPWKTALADKYFPYTHSWGSIAAMSLAVDKLLAESMPAAWERHKKCQAYCRERAAEMGLQTFTASDGSPTVTALFVPDGVAWDVFDAACRKEGVVFAGSYGRLAGKVFRVGHMGSQAHIQIVKDAMDRLERAVKAVHS